MASTPRSAAFRRLCTNLDRQRLALWTVTVVATVLLATLVDRRLYHWCTDFALRSDESLGKLYALFEPLGWFSTWLVVAVALWLVDRQRTGNSMGRAAPILWALIWAGIGSNLLKMLIRRERPRDHHGEFIFRPFGEDTFSTSGLGMPSGDAAVGFAAIFILYRMAPRVWPIWFLLGYGCAFSRMLLGAHFLSGVILACALGALCAAGVWAINPERAGAFSDQRVTVRKGTLWLVTLAGLVALFSLAFAWRPATQSDLPGIYSLEQRSWPKRHYLFSNDGTYTQAILVRGIGSGPTGEDIAAHLDRTTGTWSIGADGFLIDKTPAVAQRYDRGLRLVIDGEATVYHRIAGPPEAP
ncbi:MAG: membrane-associated phospholipid phosphatase [Planctomycetota bacterium]|jgi:membrane-associated phospholipid phosphatase